jgi:lipid-binding SYLF domain-containing protein
MKCKFGFNSALGVFLALAPPLFAQNAESNLVENAGRVMEQVLSAPETIPAAVLDQAVCVVIVPALLKFAAGMSGNYGPGVMTCRGGSGFYGPWGTPAIVLLEGSSAESQLSGSVTDFVLLLMSPRAAEHLLNSKVKLGADASAAVGPIGSTTKMDTDIAVRVEILSYSRARGLLAGTSLGGSTLRPDNAADKSLYRQELSAKDILFNRTISVPDCAKTLLATLQKASPAKKLKAVSK